MAEAFGATVEWRSATRVVSISIGKPVEETGDTRDINGFIVPKDIDLIVGDTKRSEFTETSFTISFYDGDVEKQKDDLEQILLQRLSEDTVKEIMDHVRPKMKPEDIIEEKMFHDERTGQYLIIARSTAKTINIYLYRKGHTPSL